MNASLQIVRNIYALENYTQPEDGMLFKTLGRLEAFDGNAAEYMYKEGSTDAIDGVYVVKHKNGGGKFIVFKENNDRKNEVNVKTFGAIGDNLNDDTLAINNAATYAKENNLFLTGDAGTYKVTGTININCNGDLSLMTIEADANSVSPIVRFGGTESTVTSNKRITLPKVRNNSRASGTWGAGTAVELANCNTCEITVTSATECGVGVVAGGYLSGFAYNTVNLLYVYSNKVNLNVGALSASGWSNQNVFIGGRLGFNSTDFTTSGYVGTRNIVIGNSHSQANNNLFLNTSIESAYIEYSIEFLEKTAYNIFQNCRFEGAAAKNVLFNTSIASGHTANLFVGGYQSDSIVFSYAGAGTSLYNSRTGGRNNTIDCTGYAFNIVNQSGSTSTAPHLQGFAAGQKPLSKDSSSTDYTYRLYANGLDFKVAGNTYPSLSMGINGYLNFGDGSSSPQSYFRAYGAEIRFSVNNGSAGAITPATDNVIALGSGSNRMSTIYAGTGAINTSDARSKTDIEPIDDAVLDVWEKINWRQFKMIDGKRTHTGLVAQEIKSAFESAGLDAFEYGVLCYDEWSEECEIIDADTGIVTQAKREAGNRYGVRYDEAQAIEAAMIRRKIAI